jgi:hypothetical protein
MIMRRRIFYDNEEPFGRLVDAVTYINPEIFAADVPSELISLAKTCLSKNPEHRLQFVTWSSFTPPSEKEPALVALKEKVRRNAEAAMGIPIEIEDLAQKQRTIRAVTAKLQVQIEGLVHEETIGNGLFPPLSTHQYPSQNVSAAITAFSFSPAGALGLSNRLHLVIRTSVIDAGSQLVKIEAAAFLASKASPPVPPDVSNFEGELLFAASYEEQVVREKVNFALYTALSQSQEVADDVGSDTLLLRLLR